MDVVLDFGEKVDPKDVRVVTGYGEEIPCWAGVEKAEADGRPDALRLQFRTDLRVLENKPFFVYYDNPKAAAVETPRTVFVTETEELIALDNGRLHLEFSKDSRFRSPFHVFKIVGSESANEFATTTGGTAHYGLTPCLKGDRDGQTYEFEPTKVSARQVSPWKAVVTAESASVRMTYILSADSDRVDYVYEPLDGKRISGIYTSWLSGGGIAWDDFVYPSLTGELRKAVKEANPNAHVLAWGCDNGHLPCVERHLESADCLDVAFAECGAEALRRDRRLRPGCERLPRQGARRLVVLGRREGEDSPPLQVRPAD